MKCILFSSFIAALVNAKKLDKLRGKRTLYAEDEDRELTVFDYWSGGTRTVGFTNEFGAEIEIVNKDNEDEGKGSEEGKGTDGKGTSYPPTPSPSDPLKCDIDLGITCVDEDGRNCADIQPPTFNCNTNGCVDQVSFTYIGPSQSSGILCINQSRNVLVDKTVNIGETVVATDLTELIACRMYVASSGEVTNEFEINTCQDLRLRNVYGESLRVDGCDDNNCMAPLTYRYTITNIGEAGFQITELARDRDGDVADLIDLVPDKSLDREERTIVSEVHPFDTCESGETRTSARVQADCANGGIVDDTANIVVEIIVTPAPTISPSSSPSDPPSPQPTPSPSDPPTPSPSESPSPPPTPSPSGPPTPSPSESPSTRPTPSPTGPPSPSPSSAPSPSPSRAPTPHPTLEPKSAAPVVPWGKGRLTGGGGFGKGGMGGDIFSFSSRFSGRSGNSLSLVGGRNWRKLRDDAEE